MRFIALLLTLTAAAGISAATQRATVPTAEKAPTFSAAIAPILYANCVTCLAQARLKHAAAKTLRLPDRPVPDRSKPVSDPTFLRSLLTSPWGGRVIASSPHPEELVS